MPYRHITTALSRQAMWCSWIPQHCFWVSWARLMTWYILYGSCMSYECMINPTHAGSEHKEVYVFVVVMQHMHIFSDEVRNVEKYLSNLTKQHNIYIFSCMAKWVNNFLCINTWSLFVTLLFLTYLQERCSVHLPDLLLQWVEILHMYWTSLL